MYSRLARRGLLLLSAALMAGCNTIVMNPSGDIAAQQSKLIVISTFLMLLIIVPVIFLTLFFAWRYRQSNTSAKYDPDWDHSTKLELVIWGAPLLIIIALGMLTWITTHTLDPYRKLDRLDEARPLPTNTKHMVVEVVAMDWKWLFIYPEQGIATVNELALPVDVPVEFRITATTNMNSFYVPALAGMIYAMPGMQTQLHAVINKAGQYEGFSANYSGAGFSDMRFKFHGLNQAQFDEWVTKVKTSQDNLTRKDYLELEKPSIKDPVRLYAKVDSDLYHGILNRCLLAGQVCLDKMMMVDAKVQNASNGKLKSMLVQGGRPETEICVTPAANTSSAK